MATDPVATASGFADLPMEVLRCIAVYLPKPSRAILGLALTAPPSSWRDRKGRGKLSAASDVIFRSLPRPPLPYFELWGHLDFGQIDKRVAMTLTDDDMRAILLNTDALNVLNSLKLHGCTNITGHGLDVLAGSAVLEEIDIRIDDFHQIVDEPYLISEEVTLPIIECIVRKDDMRLRTIALPNAWTKSAGPGEPDKLGLIQTRVHCAARKTRKSASGLSTTTTFVTSQSGHAWMRSYDSLKIQRMTIQNMRVQGRTLPIVMRT